MKKLYLIHCGFYDSDVCDGVYESHVNFFVAAETFEAARTKVKSVPDFTAKRMHIDGLQEVAVVDGCKILLEEDLALRGQTIVTSQKHRELAPKAALVVAEPSA